MSYIINNTRGNLIAVIQDGTINTTATSVALVGRNVSPYGQINIENLVKHLENFTNDTPPVSPQQGQLWYDLPNTSLKVWTGSVWKTVSGLTVGAAAPTGSVVVGDLWYNNVTAETRIWSGQGWVTLYSVPFASAPPPIGTNGQFYFNTVSQSLYISDAVSNVWREVGPPGVDNFLITRWESAKVVDTGTVERAIMKGWINGQVIAIVADADFQLASINAIAGFSNIRKGITLSSTSIVSGDLNGTATRAVQATTLNPGARINGVLFTGSSDITVGIGETVPVSKGGTGQTVFFPGQLLIGNNGNAEPNFLSGTDGITITNGPGSVSIGYSGINDVVGGSAIAVTQTGSQAVINNTGVTALTTPIGSGIGLSGTAGSISITNAGVTELVAGGNITLSSNRGAVVISASGGADSPVFVRDILAGPGVDVTKDSANNYTISNTGGGGAGNFLFGSSRAGEIALWPTATPPSGWRLCNGAAVSRSQFDVLFSRIGVTFGPGDGSTTFNLPNFQNRFAIGAGSDYNPGATGGYQDAVIPAHSHELTDGTTTAAGSHTHPINDPGHLHIVRNAANNADNTRPPGLWYWADRGIPPENQPDNQTNTATTGITIESGGTHTHALSGRVSVTGESATKKNLPPFLATYYMIKMEDDTVSQLTAGPGISITGQAQVFINNTGVTQLNPGAGILLSRSTGAVTISASSVGGQVELAGAIKLWAGTTAPRGYVFCDGRVLSRTSYPQLFSRIGVTFGAGDGVTTFNIPNLTDRFPVGAGGLYPMGSQGGSRDAVVVDHRHDFRDPATGYPFFVLNDYTNGIPGSSVWPRKPPSGTFPNTPNLANRDIPYVSDGPNTDNDAAWYAWTSSVGENASGKNMPPYLAARYIIKVDDDGVGGGTLVAGPGISITTEGPFTVISATGGGGGGGGSAGYAGDIKFAGYSAGTIPGWQPCNGNAVSRTEFATLFARIGTTYGAGDGSTTFNLPNLKNRFAAVHGTAFGRGATGKILTRGPTTRLLMDFEDQDSYQKDSSVGVVETDIISSITIAPYTQFGGNGTWWTQTAGTQPQPMPAPPIDNPLEPICVFGFPSNTNSPQNRFLINAFPINLSGTGATQVTFWINRGTEATWGQIPDNATEDLYFQYNTSFGSTRGPGWVDLARFTSSEPAGQWVQKTITLPAGLLNSDKNIQFRFRQTATHSDPARSFVDTWAFTMPTVNADFANPVPSGASQYLAIEAMIKMEDDTAGLGTISVSQNGTSKGDVDSINFVNSTVTVAGNVATVTGSTGNGLGYDQTWQTFVTNPANTGARRWNTTYTNDTNKPIMVNVGWRRTDDQQGITQGNFQVNGVTVASGGGVGEAFLSVLVPVGAQYRLNAVAGSPFYLINFVWAELR